MKLAAPRSGCCSRGLPLLQEACSSLIFRVYTDAAVCFFCLYYLKIYAASAPPEAQCSCSSVYSGWCLPVSCVDLWPPKALVTCTTWPNSKDREQFVCTDLSWVVGRFNHSFTTRQQTGKKVNLSIFVKPFVIYPVPLSSLTPLIVVRLLGQLCYFSGVQLLCLWGIRKQRLWEKFHNRNILSFMPFHLQQMWYRERHSSWDSYCFFMLPAQVSFEKSISTGSSCLGFSRGWEVYLGTDWHGTFGQ